MQNSNEFAQFIEELRISRNIQREDFIDGIVSLRQYYRFIKGESSLKSESINALLAKLEINSIYAYEKYKTKMDNTYSDLKAVYEEFYKRNFKKGETLLNEINLKDINTDYNRKLYNFLVIKNKFYSKSISKDTAVNEMLLLIDYPNILEKDALSFIELSGILFVQDHLISKGDYRITLHTYNILSDKDKLEVIGNKDHILPFKISSIKTLGVVGKYKESLSMSKSLINDFESSNALDIYAASFYFKALNERNLYNDDRHINTLVDLFCLLKAQNSKKYGEELKELVYKKFLIRESDVLKYKIIKK